MAPFMSLLSVERDPLDLADGGGGRARCVERWPPGEQGCLPVHPGIHARLEQPHVEEPNTPDQRSGEGVGVWACIFCCINVPVSPRRFVVCSLFPPLLWHGTDA